MGTVLVTGAGGPAGRALIGQLRGSGLRVVGVDMAPLPAGVEVDEFHQVPAAGDPSFLPVLARLIATTGASVCIPTVQEELPVVAAAADCLGARVVIGPADAVLRAQDKLTTSWTLHRWGVSVPDFCAAEDVTASDAAQGWCDGDERVVLKPRFSRGGRGVQVVEDAASLQELAGQCPGGIVQRFAPGTEYSPQVYVSPRTGRAEVVVLEKTALKEGLVGNAAAVKVAQGPAVADVAELARRAVLAMGLTGPVDLDIRRLADGTPVVLEINARFGANSASAPLLLRRVLMDYLSITHEEMAA